MMLHLHKQNEKLLVVLEFSPKLNDRLSRSASYSKEKMVYASAWKRRGRSFSQEVEMDNIHPTHPD